MDNRSNEKTEKFAALIADAIDSYFDNRQNMNSAEWARSYLSEKLADKAEQEVYKIADNIVNAIRIQKESLDSLHKAEENGQSSEAWFAEETSFDDGSYGKQAMLLSSANDAFSQIDNESTDDPIDVEVIDEDFSEDNWNKYNVKELAAKVLENAVSSALYTSFDFISESYSSVGVCAITNSDKLIESLKNGATEGIKTATACAVSIASEKGILSEPLTAAASALISGMSIEKVVTEINVGDGVSVVTEGIKAFQDIATATAAATIKMSKDEIGERAGTLIGGTIGSVFGPTGTVVGERIGAAVGKACGTEICDLISLGINKLSTAVVNTVSKVTNSLKSLFTI